MYGARQIIHAIPYNKPYDLSGINGDTDWAWGTPPFLTTHYEYVDEKYGKTKWGAHEIWCGPTYRHGLENRGAVELLEAGIIRPAMSEMRGTSHYDCCSQWKSNKHMWWCENGPRYDRVTPKDSLKVQLATLEDLVLTVRGLRKLGFKWEIPSHLQWLLKG